MARITKRATVRQARTRTGSPQEMRLRRGDRDDADEELQRARAAGSAGRVVRLSRAAIAARARYLAAWRWRRAVEARLAELGLTLTQWLVIDALHAVRAETGDAANQNQVAAKTELDRMTVSQVMAALVRRGLVDRAIDMNGRGYRIVLTSSGQKALTAASGLVEAASAGAGSA